MEFIIALLMQPIFFMYCWFVINTMIYIVQEINHEIRKGKQSFRRSMWDLEWKWKMLKGR